MKLIGLDSLNRALNDYNEKAKKTFAAKSHGTHLTLGTTSSTACRGDYGNTAYNHSQAAHAPSNAQKNSDITKAEIEAKLTGTITSHAHKYAGSSSAGGAAISANKVNTNLVIKLNGGTTEGTNLFTFNGSTAKTINITPSSIGAAASSHGTHLTIGTGANNAAAGNHTHSYLPLTGGTLSGRLHANGKISVKARGGSWIDAVNFDNVAIANNTEPGNEGSYYPLLAARTDGGHTISLGSNYTNFGFYGFKKGRTENNVDFQFSFDVNAHSTYTNSWMNVDNGMEVNGDLNAGSFRLKHAPGNHNCYIGGGNGDAASWDSHNMVIRSHWGIGFRDYQDICRIVFDTRTGNISTQGQVYSGNVVSCETGVYTNGYLSCQGDLSVGARSWLTSVTVSDKFVGETRFCGADGYYTDPWEGTGCAIKAQGNIACNGSLRGGWLTCPQGELYGWPTGSQSFLSIHTVHDGNGQGDGQTHLGYNNGDGYHHFFRGTGAMHINMHQGVQISNDFIYLAGVPLTISGYAPSRGGVWIQI
jgi:hypothetical protein